MEPLAGNGYGGKTRYQPDAACEYLPVAAAEAQPAPHFTTGNGRRRRDNTPCFTRATSARGGVIA